MGNELIVHGPNKVIVNYEWRAITNGNEICHTTHENEPMNL